MRARGVPGILLAGCLALGAAADDVPLPRAPESPFAEAPAVDAPPPSLIDAGTPSIEQLPEEPSSVSPLFLLSSNGGFSLPTDVQVTLEQLEAIVNEIREGRLKRVAFDGHREIDNAALRALTGLKGLEALSLKATAVQSDGVAYLEGLSGLRELDLSDTAVHGAAGASLARLKGLRVLRLAGTPFDDEGLVQLAPLTALEELNLSGTSITTQGLSALRKMTKMITLDLGGTRVAGGLEALQSMKFLETLHLNDTPIRDEALLPIKWLPSLGLLNVSCTKTTDATLQRFSIKKGITILHVCTDR